MSPGARVRIVLIMPRGNSDLRARLRAAFAWRGDATDRHRYADVTGWWRDADLLRAIGPALAALFPAPTAAPTVVLGPESRGCVIGPLVATHLAVGFVEARKNRTPSADSDRWVRRTTPPDYRDRHLELGFRRGLVQQSDRVLVVDDWVDTGSQAATIRQMVDDVGATWVGLACIVDGLSDPRLRRDLVVQCLLRVRDL
jgi:adenine phosphoribosyltransferase